MEREPLPLKLKLKVAAAIDYPAASEILVSFPDKWELIQRLEREGLPQSAAARTVYISAWPPEQEKATPDHFAGLSPEINLELTTYRLYKFFQPWSQPHLTVAWDAMAGQGQVVGGGPLTVRLQPIGQAQTWTGTTHGVLWECYLHRPERQANWQETLHEIWQVVEANMGVEKIYTMPHDPAFEKQWYTDFLGHLDYQPDLESPGWWSKKR